MYFLPESLEVSKTCDSQYPRGKCLAPAVKIPYRRLWADVIRSTFLSYARCGVDVWCSECEPDVFPVMIDTTAINSHSRMQVSVTM